MANENNKKMITVTRWSYERVTYRYDLELRQEDVNDIIDDFNKDLVEDQEKVPSMTVEEFYNNVLNAGWSDDNGYWQKEYKVYSWDKSRIFTQTFGDFANDMINDWIWDCDCDMVDSDIDDTSDEYSLENDYRND